MDEVRLLVHPVALDAGDRLFEDMGFKVALRLVESRQLGAGVMSVVSAPERSAG